MSHRINVKLFGKAEFSIEVRDQSALHRLGAEGQYILTDVSALTERDDLTDHLFRIRNTGGTGIHKQPAEHGCAIERLVFELDPDVAGAVPWESDASLGWTLDDGRIVAVRDAKFMGARRAGPFKIEIIHAGTKFEPWDDDAWGSQPPRPESSVALQLPGGRMLAYRVIETTTPLFVELDDWNLVPDWNAVADLTGGFAHLHEMPRRMAEWIESFGGVGVRKDALTGEAIFSDLGKGASFVSNYVQGPARWDSWNADPELDVRDIPDSYHRHPSVWPDHTWNDGHDNLHFELAHVALREFMRHHLHTGDSWRAAWSWWLFSRFAQWAATSGLCWSAPQRGGNDRLGWQWGEKSYRGTSIIFVGGLPGAFALTEQKLFTRNVIAAAVLPYAPFREALNLHRSAVINTMGEGDSAYGARDMFFIGHAKIALDKVGDVVGQPDFMPDREIVESVEKVLSSRDPATGLWPNFDQNAHVTNVFEQVYCANFIAEAIAGDYGSDEDRARWVDEFDDIVVRIRSNFVREFGRWAITVYQFTPNLIPGYVWDGNAKVGGLDVTEFTRPHMATMLGAHAYVTGDTESKRLFAKMLDTLGELADWSPPVTTVTGSELHPNGRSQRDVVITDESIPPHAVNPGKRVDWHAGMHYSAWWKVLSASFMQADTIGILRRHLGLLS